MCLLPHNILMDVKKNYIKIQLDKKHREMFDRYTELWDELHTSLAVDTFASGIKFVTE